MNSLNSILVEGVLIRDPVLATTPKGAAVCTFSIESHRSSRVDDAIVKEVSNFDIETWSALAMHCADHLSKGSGVRVVGRLVEVRWTEARNRPMSRIKIVAEHVEFRKGTPSEVEKELQGT